MLKVYELIERDTSFNMHKKVIVTNSDLHNDREALINYFKEYFFCYDELNHYFHEVRQCNVLPTMKVTPVGNTGVYTWSVGFEIITMSDDLDRNWYFTVEYGSDKVLPIAVRQAEEAFTKLIEWRDLNDE